VVGKPVSSIAGCGSGGSGWVGCGGLTAVSDGSELLIFVRQAAHSFDLCRVTHVTIRGDCSQQRRSDRVPEDCRSSVVAADVLQDQQHVR
jgi:hypothetical protein